MPRRRVVTRRQILPDPKYNEVLVAKFINIIMKKGKKSLAERIFYSALDFIQEKTSENPVQVFKKALDNVKPELEVKSRRVGGSTYQIPVEVKPYRRTALSIRWIIQNARARTEREFTKRLAGELMDAANNTGASVKKKDDTHRMAEANKAFSHYRW